MKCPYCGGGVKLVSSSVVYHSFNKGQKMWVCENYPKCDAYVGCHPNTEVPLGRLANKKLRSLKSEAHRQFDPMWKSGYMTRDNAYKWLAKEMCLTSKECHIGKFDNEMCKRAIEICRKVDNTKVQKYRLEHFGYEQVPPVFSRGYNRRKSKH